MIMKKAIVTGANGFLGKAMVKHLLKKGFFVYAIGTNQKDLDDIKSPNLDVQIGFYDKYHEMISHCKGADYLFHFAWQGLCGDDVKDYRTQLYNSSIFGDVMTYAIESDIKRVILASSVNVLEAKKQMLDVCPKPRNTCIYSTAKLAAEMIGKTIAFRNPKVEFLCAYIAMAFGPNNKSLMVPNVVISKLMQGISPDLISGDSPYDLIYVDDIVKGLLSIALKGKNLKSYYLGHEDLLSFREIFTKVGEIINPDIKLNFGAYPDSSEIDYSKIDIKALKNDTGFSCSSDFKSSVLKTAEYLKATNYLKKA